MPAGEDSKWQVSGMHDSLLILHMAITGHSSRLVMEVLIMYLVRLVAAPPESRLVHAPYACTLRFVID